MKKSELMVLVNLHFIQVASDLGLTISLAGLDANGAQVDTDAVDKILRIDYLWGDERRPYLNGADGQVRDDIIQASVHFPKAQLYPCLKAAESVFDSLPLSLWNGVDMFNKTLSQPMYDGDKVSHAVSFTIKVV